MRGMRDSIGHGERAAPAAAEDVHRTRDLQLIAQFFDVADQVGGRVPGERHRGARRGDIGLALAAAALVEQDDAVSRRIEEARHRGRASPAGAAVEERSEEHTSELQSLMRISYAVFCLKTKKKHKQQSHTT